MEKKKNEIKGKELFELSLTFTEGDEEKQFGVTMKAKKDGKETDLDLFDSDFIGMCYNGMKMVFSQIAYLYVKNLHDTGRMSDEELKALDLLNSKSKYWFERHWQYAPVETVIRERRNLPSVDWFWKRDHRITQAARISHIHYGKYAVKLHSNHK